MTPRQTGVRHSRTIGNQAVPNQPTSIRSADRRPDCPPDHRRTPTVRDTTLNRVRHFRTAENQAVVRPANRFPSDQPAVEFELEMGTSIGHRIADDVVPVPEQLGKRSRANHMRPGHESQGECRIGEVPLGKTRPCVHVRRARASGSAPRVAEKAGTVVSDRFQDPDQKIRDARGRGDGIPAVRRIQPRGTRRARANR